MKKFGHKYDGAQEQEQMLNMLNIGLGAFLLYLFHKNFGNKMSGGADGDVPNHKHVNIFLIFILFIIPLIITFIVMATDWDNAKTPIIILIFSFFTGIISLYVKQNWVNENCTYKEDHFCLYEKSNNAVNDEG